MKQQSHRYALAHGFIGPLTRKQTKRREYNLAKRARERALAYRQQLQNPIASIPDDDYDGGTYYDNFVDGRGW